MATRGRRYGGEDWKGQLDEGSEEHAPAMADLDKERRETAVTGYEIAHLFDILDYAKRGQRSYVDEGLRLAHPSQVEQNLHDLQARVAQLREKKDQDTLSRQIAKARENLPSYWIFYIAENIEHYGYARAQMLETPSGKSKPFKKAAESLREQLTEDLQEATTLTHSQKMPELTEQLAELQIRLHDYEQEPRAYLTRKGAQEIQMQSDWLLHALTDYFSQRIGEALRFESPTEIQRFDNELRFMEQKAQEIQQLVEEMQISEIKARYVQEMGKVQTLLKDIHLARQGQEQLGALRQRLERIKRLGIKGLDKEQVHASLKSIYDDLILAQEQSAQVHDYEIRFELGIDSMLLSRELEETASAHDFRLAAPDPNLAKWYAVLELSSDADSAAIKSRYKELMRRWHPDVSGASAEAEGRSKAINEAYAMLKRAGLVE